ncbi:23S rRNA (pseudouridine(1915)-N(3))-methyltransferase RlmH [Ventosimonas gracilis]|uniref:Ribosomal RNA large subunit methyltransferase H n=1 Tax=Ventosimonas gracilis TaxID=1680762 RepID=A0A139SIF8_9GAMM|nr:23S rRNA (pseudouridine(1915)-N(3))-methyltransferase RlmH [Ventosimonas gracilis]KXU34270.1 23S rRNA (pseudouridine(1915)-N(3))-methyltransferase RlmH [Ventosimonas gracilis]
MLLRVIAVGSKMPVWVEQGFAEYAKRMPAEFSLQLVEIPLGTRSKNADIARLMQKEGQQMLSKMAAGEKRITLEVQGASWSTEQLAQNLQSWREQTRVVNFLIGGPEGLAGEVCARSDARWSLSKLTLAHPLVRIVLAEQLYRAWTRIAGHPYHR